MKRDITQQLAQVSKEEFWTVAEKEIKALVGKPLLNC
jgi:hypothetical protein